MTHSVTFLQMIRLDRKEAPEVQTKRALTGILGIPLVCVIVYAFLKRKAGICEERYGISECRPHPIRFVVLAFAICVSVYGILRVKRVYVQYYNYGVE